MKKAETQKNDTDDLDKKIRQRAFRIWVEEGYPFGKEREHWQRAKTEVMAAQPSFVESVLK